jgi:hypothetical protein
MNSYAESKNNNQLIFCKATDAPSGQQDTAKYLYEHVLAQKGKFQHKKLNKLLNELNIPVKSYTINFGRKLGYCVGITLFFEKSKIKSEKLHKQISTNSIYVEFEKPIPLGLVSPLLSNSNGDWMDGEKEFYGEQLIKDIQGTKP